MENQDERLIRIADCGVEKTLSYAKALNFHQGDAYWGCAVAFRALQLAADLLSREQLWERNVLHVASSHPGPGVRDTIEYITHSVSNNRFVLTNANAEIACTSDLQYAWQIRDEKYHVDIRLRDNFVPTEFFKLLEEIESGKATVLTHSRLNEIKKSLEEKIWQEPLKQSFPHADIRLL